VPEPFFSLRLIQYGHRTSKSALSKLECGSD
jgi:hypothetical protein